MYDTSQLKNGKYFKGSYADFESTNGWFVGDFLEEGNPRKTDQVEICYHVHTKGEIVKPHYHQEKVEVMIVLSGKVRVGINGEDMTLEKGDFYFADINNVIECEFLEDTTVFAIHSPSLPTDKHEPE